MVTTHGAETPFHLPPNWLGDGVVARISTESLQEELINANIPVVNVSAIELPRREFPRVSFDYQATARLAAAHFRERGYRHFGYIGPLDQEVVSRHAKAFAEVVCEDPAKVGMFDYKAGVDSTQDFSAIQARLGDWLESLPKPVGVFNWGTEAGARVLDLCRYREIAVPIELALLADDDDPLICSATTPPMSAVLHAAEQVGYHAAKQLDRMLSNNVKGGHRSNKADVPIELIAPVQVTARASTNAYAIEDTEMIRAITYIRENAYHPLSVMQIAEAVPIGRRTLERKFRHTFGRTPLEEIRRLRVERVKELLTTTELPISQIADKAGFSSPEHMTNTFRRLVSASPLRYRKKVQGT